jgi:DNA-binding transcriptional ArsR family regulator
MTFGTRDEEKPGLRSKRLEDALKHPLRAQMFAELNKRSMGLPELAVALGKPLARVEYHYGVLEAAGGAAGAGGAPGSRGVHGRDG